MIVGDGDKSDGGHPTDEFYIQMAPENYPPMWAPMSYITDALFDWSGLYKNDEFVKELLALFNDGERPFTHLSTLLNATKRRG